jgi:hypothetical protein
VSSALHEGDGGQSDKAVCLAAVTVRLSANGRLGSHCRADQRDCGTKAFGYAQGQKKRVFLVHSKAGGYKDLPSDLHGETIGHVPDDGRQVDVSFRNKLMNVMAKLLLRPSCPPQF